MIIISNGLGIHFWRTGEPSFNEFPQPGFDHVPYYHKVNAEDKNLIQFIDDDDLIDYELRVYNKKGVLLDTLTFGRIEAQLYEKLFVAELVDVTNEFIKLTINVESSGEELAYTDLLDVKLHHRNTRIIKYANKIDLENLIYIRPTFPQLVNGDISGGTIAPSTSEGAGNAWAYSGAFSGCAVATLPASLAPTQRFRMPLAIVGGRTYKVTLSLRVVDGGGGAGNYTDWKMYFTDGITFTNVQTNLNRDLGNQVIQLTLVAAQDWPYIEITAQSNHVNGYSRDVIVLSANVDEPVGIVDESPDFSLRLPIKFAEGRSPEENENENSSDGTTSTLFTSTKKQIFMQLDPLPPYMNYKVSIALMHSSRFIENKSYTKENEYSTKSLNPSFNYEEGEAWLTENPI